MNIALIIAGGTGERMNQEIPKQFLHIENKPIIIYTMEAFQNHPSINSIFVVCLDGWHDILRAYARQFNITKFSSIVSSGNTRHMSIFNGLMSLTDVAGNDDNIMIMDANRPLVSSDIISDGLATCEMHGSSISVVPCVDSMYISTDGIILDDKAKRESLFRGQAPETIKYGKAIDIYMKANALNITDLPFSGLMLEFNEHVHISKGSEKNIKITTTEDIEIFKALMNVNKDSYLK